MSRCSCGGVSQTTMLALSREGFPFLKGCLIVAASQVPHVHRFAVIPHESSIWAARHHLKLCKTATYSYYPTMIVLGIESPSILQGPNLWFSTLMMPDIYASQAAQNVPALAFFGWPLIPFLPRPQSQILTYAPWHTKQAASGTRLLILNLGFSQLDFADIFVDRRIFS